MDGGEAMYTTTAESMVLPPHSMAADGGSPATAALVDENSFGDLLAELLRTLPAEASALFLRSLSGLSPSESHDFCEYVAKLKPQKQFRVIQAMSEATVDGKRNFLTTLAKKFEEQQRKQQELQVQDERDMEAHVKRKEALYAQERVKMLNPTDKKFHSFNATVGAGVSVNETRTNGGNGAVTVNASGNGSPGGTSSSSSSSSPSPSNGQGKGNNLIVGIAPGGTVRSLSSSSLVITKEDIKQVGALLGNAHITESEMNLRKLETNKKAYAMMKAREEEDTAEALDAVAELLDGSKRDRPESSHNLIKQEQKPLQRTRSEEQSGEYTGASSPQYEDGGDGGEGAEGSESPSASADGEDPDAPSTKRWTKRQDTALRDSVRLHGEKNWKAIAELVPGRNHAQCLQRWRKVLKPGLVKGHWSFEEDQILEYLVTQGCNNWGQIAERIPGRTPKQCRERWKNHLDPAINKGPYTEDEDKIILDAQDRLGNKWSQIAQLLKGRTEDSVKIRWKSLKQNPAKAAASHAQQKKVQEQQLRQERHGQGHVHTHMAPSPSPSPSHQHAMHPHSAMHGYHQSPSMMRQRQLELLQQQNQMQNSEAAQLEQQQQLQQHQLQLRLQERLMQQQQLHRQSQLQPSMMNMLTGTSSTGDLKQDPSSLSSMEVPSSFQGAHGGNPHMYSTGNVSSSGFDMATTQTTPSSFAYMPPASSNIVSGVGIGIHHHNGNSPVQGDDAHHSTNSWQMQGDLGDGFTRLGENPPPASFWDNYPKEGGDALPEPIPLSSHMTHQHHDLTGAYAHSGASQFAVPPVDVYDDNDDAMFEKLASELGNNSLHFAPL